MDELFLRASPTFFVDAANINVGDLPCLLTDEALSAPNVEDLFGYHAATATATA